MAAIAVEEAALCGHHRQIVGAELPDLRARDGDGLAVRRLGLEPAVVGDRQRDHRVAQHQRRQIDDQQLLILDADPEQASVFGADDRFDHERIGEAKAERADAVCADFQPQRRAAVDPQPLGRDGDVDVVVQHVVVDEIVFGVEPAALRQAIARRV